MPIFGEGDWLPFHNIDEYDFNEQLGVCNVNQSNDSLNISQIQNCLIFDQFKCDTNRYNSILQTK